MEEETGSVDERTRMLKDAPAAHRPPYIAFNPSSAWQHSESSEAVVDEEEWQYDLATVNSHPTGLGVESTAEETRAPTSKGYGSLSSQRSAGQEQGTGEDADGSSAVNEVDNAEAEPKFIGVSRGRFWLVFGGILFAYFVCINLVPFNRNADHIQGCMFRFDTHGIQSSGHHLLFPVVEFSILVIYGVPIDVNGFSTSLWPGV